jgi:hypothetical protein
MAPTTTEVIETIEAQIADAEVSESDLAGGVLAVIPDSEVGRFYGLARREGFDADTKRDPSGDNLVATIDAEEEEAYDDSGLAKIFG